MDDVIIVVQGGLVRDILVTNKENIAVTLVDLDDLENEEKLTISRNNYPTWYTKANWKDVVGDVVDKKDLILIEDE